MAKRTAPVAAPGAAEPRARVLAEPTRRRVWEAVRASPAPVGVAQLAQSVALHPNTVRLHLARLVGAGLVSEDTEAERHPGRPGYRYPATGSDPVSQAAAYRRLAALLAQAVRTGVNAREAGRAADAARLAGADPLDAVIGALAAEGFAPDVAGVTDDQIEVVLRACPFADAAAEDPATICQLHLGLAEGAVQSIGGLTVDGLRINDPHQAACQLLFHRVPRALRRA